MPRSGTTWVAQILASHPNVRMKFDPLFSYAFKGALDVESCVDDWHRLFEASYHTADPYMDQDGPRARGLIPTFEEKNAAPDVLAIKSNRRHELLAQALRRGIDAKALLIVRDPVAAIESWLTNPSEFPESADPASEWRTGACRKGGGGEGEYWGFDDWRLTASLFLELSEALPETTRLLRYEEIDENPEAVAASIFAWLGLEMEAQTLAFLRLSRRNHSDHPRAVFRDPARRVKRGGALPPGVADEIRAELINGRLARFLAREPGAAKAAG